MANEQITLTTPIAQPSITAYTPVCLYLSLTLPQIAVEVIGTDGQRLLFTYPAAGTSMDTDAKVRSTIEALNTINLSARSLWRRVFDKLVADFPARFPGGASVP